jgi:beta-N-acetylhexosaminidase
MSYLMIDLEGTEITSREEKWLQDTRVCGVIMFSRNYESPQQISELNQRVRQIAGRQVIVAVDQEGGRVQRCREGITRYPPMLELAERDGATDGALQDGGWLLASEMLALGFDISFAPVLDVEYGGSKVIGDRAFGRTPEQSEAAVGCFLAGMHEAGMAATAKHFPGHGYVEADSHLELPVDERSLEQISASCLKPFSHLVSNYQAVMPAHVLYPKVDKAMPAGFSSLWLQEILRKQLGFQGVIFSDDLSMQGAQEFGDINQTAQLAEQAGCDVLLVCNAPDKIEALLATDTISPSSQQLSRILALAGSQQLDLDELYRTQRSIKTRRWIEG